MSDSMSVCLSVCLSDLNSNSSNNAKGERIKRSSTLRIPTWSPTVVLTEPDNA